MRQIQTWTEAGALLPEKGGKHPGRGASRLYPAEEVDIAKLISAISHYGMSVKEVKSVADVFRKIAFAPQRYDFKDLTKAIKLCERMEDPSDTATEPQDLTYVEGWIAIEAAKRGLDSPEMRLYRKVHGGWLVRIEEMPYRDLMLMKPKPAGWRAGYILNLAEIFGK